MSDTPAFAGRLATPPAALRSLHHLVERWREGSKQPPRTIDALMDIVESGKSEDVRMLEWLHILRHKPRWDITHTSRAESNAAAIWTASGHHPQLLSQLLAQLAEGLCGGEGLCPSMAAACRRLRPLEQAEPLLQAVFAALLSVQDDPEQLIDVCIQHSRTPRALMTRVGLPADLPILDQVEAVIPAVLKRHASDPTLQREASLWVLSALREGDTKTRDAVTIGLLTTLQYEEAAALTDLCWWLGELYGPKVKGSRWRHLPPAAQQVLEDWLRQG